MTMIENLLTAPLLVWACFAVVAVLVFEGLRAWHQPWAKPALVVYGTIGVWYPGDYVMSGAENYEGFASGTLNVALFQVIACLVILRIIFPSVVRRFCRGLVSDNSRVIIKQHWLWLMLWLSIGLWFLLLVIALFRLSSEPNFDSLWPAFFWPPLCDQKVGMFSHGGLGDSTSFIWAALGYIQRLDYAIFGVLAILGTGKVRTIAILMMGLSWPYIFFDRMRNVMLSVLLPGMGAFWIASRKPLLFKILVSCLCLVCLDYWFKIVLVYRSEYGMAAFSRTLDEGEHTHYGLDMLKELCFINQFMSTGHFLPNWGQRYYAEVMNFVPRALWPGKPTIGLDYAIARGFGGASGGHGIFVTVATGLVGQGIVNFGPLLGVLAVALLLSIWIGILSRLWMQRKSPVRLLLFLVGLGITFNCGRDITLLVLFPFVFGYMFVRLWEWLGPKTNFNPARGPKRSGSGR